MHAKFYSFKNETLASLSCSLTDVLNIHTLKSNCQFIVCPLYCVSGIVICVVVTMCVILFCMWPFLCILNKSYMIRLQVHVETNSMFSDFCNNILHLQ